MFKQRGLVFASAALMVLLTTTAVAQNATAPSAAPAVDASQAPDSAAESHGKSRWANKDHESDWHHEHGRAAKRLQKMMRFLNVTEDQRHQILLIAENTRHATVVELSALPKDAKLSRKAIWEKNMTQARAQIKEVLTPEQRAKLEAQMAKHKSERKDENKQG